MTRLATLPTTSERPGWRFYRSTATSSGSTAAKYKPSEVDFVKSFYAVLRRWQSETLFLSDPDKITEHPSYKALVANATLVMPLIVAELQTEPSSLVWVLEDAFRERPYADADVGDLQAMTNAWISWAHHNGRAPI